MTGRIEVAKQQKGAAAQKKLIDKPIKESAASLSMTFHELLLKSCCQSMTHGTTKTHET